MADLEKTVAIIFEGVDQMGSGVTSATRQLDNLAGSVEQAARPLADATFAIAKFEGALLAAGAAASLVAVKVAGDFDSGFREITTLLDEPAEALDQFRGDILDYASTSTQSIETVNQALYSLVSAGADTSNALDRLAAAEQLAIGGKTDLATAAGVLSGSLNAYGSAAGDAEDVTDALFVGVKNGITTVGELASSLPQVTSLAGQLGVGFDEVVSAVSALTSTGLPTSQAVTQIAAALNSVLGPSEKAKTTAEALGIEFDATALRSEGLAGFLEILGDATGGSEEQMNALFGSSEATRGVLALLGPVAEQFAGNLEDMDEKAGATAAAVEKMAEDIGLGTQRIQNAITTTLVGIGMPILDEFNGIQEAIAAIFNAIGVSLDDGQLNQFVQQLEGVFQDVEATLMEVAQNLPDALEMADWSGFLNGIEAIRDAVSELFDGADLATAEGLASVITTLGTGFELLSEYTAGAITAIGPFIEQLADLAGWIMEIDPAWVVMLGTIGGSAVVLTTVLSAFSSFLGIVNGLAGSKGALPAMTGATSKLTTALGVSSKLGLAGAAVAAAYGIKELYDRVEEFNEFKLTFSDELEKELDKTTGAQRAATEVSLFSVQKIAEGYNALSEKFGWGAEAGEDFMLVSKEAEASALEIQKFVAASGDVEDAMDDTGGAILEGFKAWEQWNEAAETARKVSEATEKAHSKNEETLWDYVGAIDAGATAWEKVGENTYAAASNTEAVNEALEKVKKQYEAGMIGEGAYSEMVQTLEGVRQGGGEAGSSLSSMGGKARDAGGEMELSAEKVFELEKQMNELASNEKIKAMEFSASIQVAELEADAKKVEAVLSATSTTIEATAGAVDGLFSSLAGGDLSFSQQWDLEKAVDQQLEIQKEAAKYQNEALKAQTELMREKTKALRNGDGLVKIDSTGLEPALEMIMWEIIEKVQLRANAEGAEFLLNIGGGA